MKLGSLLFREARRPVTRLTRFGLRSRTRGTALRRVFYHREKLIVRPRNEFRASANGALSVSVPAPLRHAALVDPI